MLKEFKTFAMRGNVLDMAVGIITGGAFSKIVTSLVNDVLMPPIGMILGGVNFTKLSITLKAATVDATGKAVSAVTINYGSFLQTTVDFTIIAFTIFIMIKAMNKVVKKEAAAPSAPPPPPKSEVLLEEIRDLLKK